MEIAARVIFGNRSPRRRPGATCTALLENKCGLINQANPCRCTKKTRAFMDAGYVDPHRLRFARARDTYPRPRRRAATKEFDQFRNDQYAAIFRDQPFLPISDQIARLRKTIVGEPFRHTLELDN